MGHNLLPESLSKESISSASYLAEGRYHICSETHDGVVVKHPKSIDAALSFSQQEKMLNMKKKCLDDFMPDTQLVPCDKQLGSYVALQKKVLGKALKDVDVGKLSRNELLDLHYLLYKILEYMIGHEDSIDVIGYQGEEDGKILTKYHKTILLNPNHSTNIFMDMDRNFFLVDNLSEKGSLRVTCRLARILYAIRLLTRVNILLLFK